MNDRAYNITVKFVCLFLARQPPVGQGLLIHEVSRSHTTTHQSRYEPYRRVISSSQRSLPDNTQQSQQTNNHAPGGIRSHNPSRRAATGTGTEQYSFVLFLFFPLWRCGPTRAMASLFLRFLDHTQRRITVGRTPLDAWSARRRELYLTTHNTHNRQTSMPRVGFEPTISAGERPLGPAYNSTVQALKHNMNKSTVYDMSAEA